ncbi:MAG: hypothetical protein OEV06_02740, partial [Anaerolineae bacterium]|nr:hypothetical protein [Anaerolineae bacterium]
MKRILSVVIFSALLGLACDFSTLPGFFSGQPATPTTAVSAPVPTEPAVVDTPIPSQESTATTAVVVDPVCVAPGPHDALIETSYEDYPNQFLLFLNSGGAPSTLQANLEALGIANLAPSVAVADLTGDGKFDVVVSFLEPEPQTVPTPGALLIYTCLGDRYTLTHIELSGDFQGAPRILHLQDMNADGAAEVISSSSTCGAHTCFESAKILSWSGSSFEDRLDGSTDNLPYPDLQITDYDRDGFYNLEVTGRGFGSVGAGPQRTVTRIWTYDREGGLWTASEEILGASEYRIHVLHDADAAARRGEYPVAIVLYQQVIDNDGLLDWMDQENERLNLSAYAAYKLVVVFAAQGDRGRAFDQLDQF